MTSPVSFYLHVWLTFMAHITACLGYRTCLRVSPPKGERSWVSTHQFPYVTGGCCSQECQLPRISAGTCHRKPPARSRASSIRYVDRALLPHRNLITTSPPRCPSLSPPNQTAPFLSTCPSHENVFPVPSASELPSLNIYQWVIVLLIGC